MIMANKYGERGSPCRRPLLLLLDLIGNNLTDAFVDGTAIRYRPVIVETGGIRSLGGQRERSGIKLLQQPTRISADEDPPRETSPIG